MGLVNTGVTYILYLVLLLFLNYHTAYAIAYVAGIALAFALNSRIVFGTEWSIVRMLIYPIIYIVMYLVNAPLLSLFVSGLKLPKAFAPLLVTASTLPLGYLLNKVILTAQYRSE